MIKDVAAVILGGGKGTRLFPLTKNRSKPAVPFGGKYRLIDVPISNCINSGVQKIYVLTQFNSESLNRHLNLTYQFDSFSKRFVSLIAAEQTYENTEWFQGTADAVRQSIVHIEDSNAKYVLILSGDQLYKMDFEELLNFHKKNKADITICTLPVSEEDAHSFGIMQLNQEGRITTFKEKPSKNELKNLSSFPIDSKKPFLASMGIYLFNFKILKEVLYNTNKTDFGHDIIPDTLNKYKVFGYIFKGYWNDIGTIKSFYHENLNLTKIATDFSLYNMSQPLYTNVRHLPPAKLINTHVDSALITEGSVAKDSVIKNSVIGLRSIICENTIIENAIIMGIDKYPEKIQNLFVNKRYHPKIGIGKNVIIKNAIIDKNVWIQRNVKIINKNNIKDYDSDLYYIRDYIVIIPKNTVIPTNTII